MLAGPDLLVILVIALIVFGPQKLPELAKTIGKALGEFKKTTEEVKESIGIKDLEEMRSNLIGMDLFTDLAEKVSASMTNKEDSIQGRTSSPGEASIPIGNAKDLEKEKNAKSEGSKGKIPREGVPS
jgi:TatA/E family protein of Tat protein translocase